MSGVLTSYGIAYLRIGGGTTPHIHRDGAERALCGQEPVVWAGDGRLDVEFDHDGRCRTCWRIAGPEVTSIWDEGFA